MTRQFSPEKSGFLRLHHRMARKQADQAEKCGMALRFTLTIAAQKARLTMLNHAIDEKGQRLLSQAINSAMRKGVHTIELDLRNLRISEQSVDLLISSTRSMLRNKMEFSVLAPLTLSVSDIQTFETPKFDASMIEYASTEDMTESATQLEAAA